MKKNLLLIAALALFAAHPGYAADKETERVIKSAPVIVDAVELIAVLRPTEGNNARGFVSFRPVEDGKVEVTGRVTGLKPDSKHGIHIHQYGDLSAADGTSLGDHYNPLDHKHGLPSQTTRHPGDFGNLEADGNGVAVLKLVVDNVTLAGQKNPVIGRGVVVHEKADDGGQPTGNAGSRIATGVIGVKNPATNPKS